METSFVSYSFAQYINFRVAMELLQFVSQFIFFLARKTNKIWISLNWTDFKYSNVLLDIISNAIKIMSGSFDQSNLIQLLRTNQYFCLTFLIRIQRIILGLLFINDYINWLAPESDFCFVNFFLSRWIMFSYYGHDKNDTNFSFIANKFVIEHNLTMYFCFVFVGW